MKKSVFLLILLNSILGLSSTKAQLVNGDFTSGYTGWTLVGPDPATFAPDSSSPPSGFGFAAAIFSTTTADPGNVDPDPAGSATAADIATALGIGALPGSPNSSTVTDGQAFVQTFSLSATSTLTFQYSSNTRDLTGYDGVGYALDGVFHSLPINSSLSSYTTIAPITLGAGSHTLGFAAYNTGDNYSRTFLNVGDIEVSEVPEPATWMMLAFGSALLLAGRRVVARAVAGRA